MRIKTERLFTFVQHKATVLVYQSNFVLFERDTVRLVSTFIPYGQLLQLHINPSGWSVARRIKCDKHETSLSLHTSESSRFVIATANDRLDRTKSCTKNGTVQATQSPRS